jgi:DNA-binding FadR family transcriptional regulator
VSEAITIAFGAAEQVVRRIRAKIGSGQIRPNGWSDALREIDEILDLIPLTILERTAVREAMIHLINEQRARMNTSKPTAR